MHYLLACRVEFPVEQDLGHQAQSASQTYLTSYARWRTRQKLYQCNFELALAFAATCFTPTCHKSVSYVSWVKLKIK